MRRKPPIPFTVIAYVAATATAAVATLAYGGPDQRSLIGAGLLAVALFALLRGVFVSWVFLVLVEVSFFVNTLITTPVWWWWVVPIKLALVALLLSRPTWRYVRRRNEKTPPQRGFR